MIMRGGCYVLNEMQDICSCCCMTFFVIWTFYTQKDSAARTPANSSHCPSTAADITHIQKQHSNSTTGKVGVYFRLMMEEL